MAELWNLDRMEQLLEEMEPAEIRARFGAELAAHPQCLAMLEAFEGLDEGFARLKAALPAAPLLPAASPVEPSVFSLPQAPRAPSVLSRWSRWAMPLAAALLLGLLLTTRTAEKVLKETAQSKERPMETVEAVAPAQAAESLPAEDQPLPTPMTLPDADAETAGKADAKAETVGSAGPRKDAVPTPPPARPSLRKSSKQAAYDELQAYDKKSAAPMAPRQREELPRPALAEAATQTERFKANEDRAPETASGLAAEAAPPLPAVQEERVASRPELDDADQGVRKTQAQQAGAVRDQAQPNPQVTEDMSTKMPRGRRMSSIMEIAPGVSQDWIVNYNAARKDPKARAALFAPNLRPPFADRAGEDGAWPELHQIPQSDGKLLVEALDARGAVIGSYLLELDAQGRCLAVTAK